MALFSLFYFLIEQLYTTTTVVLVIQSIYYDYFRKWRNGDDKESNQEVVAYIPYKFKLLSPKATILCYVYEFLKIISCLFIG